MRMRRRHRRLQIHKSKIRVMKYIRHVRKQRPPTLRIRRIIRCSRRSRSAHRLMRNHIPRNRKTHLRQLVRIRNNNRCISMSMGPSHQRHCNPARNQHRSAVPRQPAVIS